jgi:hypothetical protein
VSLMFNRSEHLAIKSAADVVCHTSHVTRHTSHVTRHTSHLTPHTSHVTRLSPQVGDTLVYNGHSSSCDALQAGVVTITTAARAMACR